MAEITIKKIAEVVQGAIEGDPEMTVTGLAPLEAAGEREITFVASGKYSQALAESRAAAAIVPDDFTTEASLTLIRVEDPTLAMAEAAWLFVEPPAHPGQVMQGSWVDPTAVVADGASVYPMAYVGPGAWIGPEAVLHPFTYVGPGARVGARSVLHPHVVIQAGVEIGQDCVIQPGAVIGGDGFGFAHRADFSHVRIPQVGTVVVGDEVDIGANTTIDRATFEQTVIGDGVRIDNLVQVGHNVTVGPNTILVAQVGLSGSVKVGRNCMLGGKVGVTDHVTIGDEAKVGAGSGVISDLEPCATVIGQPAMPRMAAFRMINSLPKVPELIRQVNKMERRLSALEDEGRQRKGKKEA